MEIIGRLRYGAWRVEDISETMPLGLVGAAAGNAEAAPRRAPWSRKTCARANCAHACLTALGVLLSAIQGDPDDPVGNAGAAEAGERPPLRGRLLQNGAVMGFSPQQVGRMSLFQYAACVDGVNEANGAETIDPPSDDEFLAAKARVWRPLKASLKNHGNQ
jgi:hypothetical protein